MSITAVSNLPIHPLLWRVGGLLSCIAGFTCYAMSPPLHYLIGQWTPLKITIYVLVSSLAFMMMLFVESCRVWRTVRSFLFKAPVGFLVLTLTSLYSFWEDRSEEGKVVEKGFKKWMNLISTGAFALMALSLSMQLQIGFEVGISNFLLGCFFVTLMKMNPMLAPLALVFCYLFLNTRSISDFLLQRRERGPKEHVDTNIDQDDNPAHYMDMEDQGFQY